MDNDTIVQKIFNTFKVLKAVSIEFFFKASYIFSLALYLCWVLRAGPKFSKWLETKALICSHTNTAALGS